jgi:AcrR family transcriptional regulator
MTQKNIPDARNRILKAAEKIFAEKSFEGSRVDEIAREANVPKSLIYYHFRSKEDILDALTQNFISEYMSLIEPAETDTHQAKAKTMSMRLENQYGDFAKKNSDLMRVMFIDSLKKSKEKPVLFKIVEEMIKAERKLPIYQTAKDYDIQERLAAEFFTGLIPLYAFICFSESWVKYFGMENESFGRLFLKLISETHGAYHKNHD